MKNEDEEVASLVEQCPYLMCMSAASTGLVIPYPKEVVPLLMKASVLPSTCVDRAFPAIPRRYFESRTRGFFLMV